MTAVRVDHPERSQLGMNHLFDAELRAKPGMEPVVNTEGREGELIGSAVGTIKGEKLNGQIRFSMFAEDCAYLLVKAGIEPAPDQNLCKTNPGGFIETKDGAVIQFDGKGYGLRGPDKRNPHLWLLTAALQFATRDERYQWLNATLGTWEGQFDEDTGQITYRAFVASDGLSQRESTSRLEACSCG